MADGSSRCVLLSHGFEINGKRHRVTLSTHSINWKPEGSSDFGWQVPLNEVISVRPVESSRSSCFSCFTSPEDECYNSLERVAFNITTFRLHFIERGWKHRWKLRSATFHNSNSSIIHQWMTNIQEILSSFSHRPHRLLVFINPFGGKKQAPKVYEKKIRPLFELAGIDSQVIVTDRANHAFDLLQELSLAKLDGVVAVGGDGMFSELLNGLLLRTQRDSAIDVNDPQSQLTRPDLRIGIIPAGSTDAMVYSTTGTSDPVTSALHIIIGDNVAVDVCGIFHESTLLKYCTSMLAYGYFGDTLVESERYRWLGPCRYDWAGIKKVLRNRAYDGELLFRAPVQAETSPYDKIKCRTGCKICERAHEQILSSVNKDHITTTESWNCLRGRFLGINNVTLTCACGLTKQGLSPTAHLGDGYTDLILIKKCSRLNYMRFLLRSAFHHDDPFSLNFVRVYRVREFQFRPICLDEVDGSSWATSSDVKHASSRQQTYSSIWNCDGEILEEPAISVKVFCQLVRLFARGIEDDVYECASTITSKAHLQKMVLNGN